LGITDWKKLRGGGGTDPKRTTLASQEEIRARASGERPKPQIRGSSERLIGVLKTKMQKGHSDGHKEGSDLKKGRYGKTHPEFKKALHFVWGKRSMRVKKKMLHFCQKIHLLYDPDHRGKN